MDPQLMAQLLAFLQTNPEYTAKNVAKPVSLTEQAKQTNYQQDQMQSLGNPLFAALLGGGQGFDMSQFQDVQNGVDTYNVPNDPLAAYHNLPDGSEEKTIAKYLSEDGLSPEQIVSKFKDAGYVDDKTDKALSRVRATANSMFKDKATYDQQISSVPGYDPSTGQWSVPDGGQHVAGKLTMPKYQRSDVAAIFDKAGLPTPDKMFGPSDFGADGSQQQHLAAQGQQISDLGSQVGSDKTAWQGTQAATGLADQMKTARLAQLQHLLSTAAAVDPHINGTGGVAHSEQLKQFPQWAQLGGPTTDLMAAKYANPNHPDARFTSKKDANGNTVPDGAQAIAYDKYIKDATKQSALIRKQATDAKSAQFDQAYAQHRADLTASSGLTPLTLAMLQRSQALRQLG